MDSSTESSLESVLGHKYPQIAHGTMTDSETVSSSESDSEFEVDETPSFYEKLFRMGSEKSIFCRIDFGPQMGFAFLRSLKKANKRKAANQSSENFSQSTISGDHHEKGGELKRRGAGVDSTKKEVKPKQMCMVCGCTDQQLNIHDVCEPCVVHWNIGEASLAPQKLERYRNSFRGKTMAKISAFKNKFFEYFTVPEPSESPENSASTVVNRQSFQLRWEKDKMSLCSADSTLEESNEDQNVQLLVTALDMDYETAREDVRAIYNGELISKLDTYNELYSASDYESELDCNYWSGSDTETSTESGIDPLDPEELVFHPRKRDLCFPHRLWRSYQKVLAIREEAKERKNEKIYNKTRRNYKAMIREFSFRIEKERRDERKFVRERRVRNRMVKKYIRIQLEVRAQREKERQAREEEIKAKAAERRKYRNQLALEGAHRLYYERQKAKKPPVTGFQAFKQSLASLLPKSKVQAKANNEPPILSSENSPKGISEEKKNEAPPNNEKTPETPESQSAADHQDPKKTTKTPFLDISTRFFTEGPSAKELCQLVKNSKLFGRSDRNGGGTDEDKQATEEEKHVSPTNNQSNLDQAQEEKSPGSEKTLNESSPTVTSKS